MREGRHLGAHTGAEPPEPTSDDSKITTRPPRSPVARYSPFASNSTALIRSSAWGVRGDASVAGPAAPVQPPPLASAQAHHLAPLWQPLRPTSRLIIAIRGCGAPSAGSSVESFSPKTCLNRQFAFAIDGAACTAKHGVQSARPQSTSRAAMPTAYLELLGGDRPGSPLDHQRFGRPRHLNKFFSSDRERAKVLLVVSLRLRVM